MRNRMKWTIGLLALSLGAASCSWLDGNDAPDEELTAVVQRGDLPIVVRAAGKIHAERSEKVFHQVDGGRLTVSVVEEEGNEVKKGDVVVEFDNAELIEEKQRREAAKQAADTTLQIAKREFDIVTRQNQEDLKEAEFAVEAARLELEKFRNGDLPQRLEELKFEVEKAQAQLAQARDSLDSLNDPELIKHGFVTRMQIEEEKLAVRTAEIRLTLAKADLTVYTKYTQKVRERELIVDLEGAESRLEKVRTVNANRLEQKQAELDEKQEKARRAHYQLQEINARLDGTTLLAPASGVIVYGDTDEKRWWRQPDVRIGATFRKNEIIMTIPDMRQLSVELEVPESDINKVELGQPVRITVEAHPDHPFKGTVSRIGNVPIEGHRSDVGGKKFDVTVTMPPTDLNLKPGISAKADIQAATLRNVLHLPVNALFVDEARYFVFKLNASNEPEPVQVQVGTANDTRVEVAAGLEEGERVLLYRPDNVALPPAEEEGKGDAAADDDAAGKASSDEDAEPKTKTAGTASQKQRGRAHVHSGQSGSGTSAHAGGGGS